MAKPVAAAAGRSGTRKKGQEEDVQEERAQARPARTGACAGLFQQHHRHHLGHQRQRAGVEEFGIARLPRIA